MSWKAGHSLVDLRNSSEVSERLLREEVSLFPVSPSHFLPSLTPCRSSRTWDWCVLREYTDKPVIKLFNAILSASKVNDESQSLADQVGLKDEKTRRKEKDNILGRGGKEVLTKENFLDMVRKG